MLVAVRAAEGRVTGGAAEELGGRLSMEVTLSSRGSSRRKPALWGFGKTASVQALEAMQSP